MLNILYIVIIFYIPCLLIMKFWWIIVVSKQQKVFTLVVKNKETGWVLFILALLPLISNVKLYKIFLSQVSDSLLETLFSEKNLT